jgi:hypothetical protein
VWWLWRVLRIVGMGACREMDGVLGALLYLKLWLGPSMCSGSRRHEFCGWICHFWLQDGRDGNGMALSCMIGFIDNPSFSPFSYTASMPTRPRHHCPSPTCRL